MMKELVVPIKGMHCRACEITLTDSLEELPDVTKAEVSLRSKTAAIYFKHQPPMSVVRRVIQKSGYDIGYDHKPWFSNNAADYKDALLGVIVVAVLAFVISLSGLSALNAGSIDSGGVIVAMVVGLTAGFSTCMALVGGLVLGLSARHAEKHPSATTMQKFRPHLFFNLSRIVTFFVLGGVIGWLGSAFQLQGSLLGILTIVVGVVMLLLGLQLTNLFPRLSGGGLTLPSGISRALGLKSRQQKEYSHNNAIALGAISFILPCGFTQAMQLYAVSTGSFVTGALVMGLFAIGTAPGLLGVGGLASVVEGSFAKRFFKVVGVAVATMALINISNGLNLTGWQLPRLPERGAATSQSSSANKADGKGAAPLSADRVLRTTYVSLEEDIVPSEFTIQAGMPYTLEVDAKVNGEGCMSTIMVPGLINKPESLRAGSKMTFEFTANRPGTYQITCAMGVPRGTIKVI